MLNQHTTCPDCEGKGLVAGSICTTCGGSGSVRSKRIPATTTAAAGPAGPAGLARTLSSERATANADALVRTLLESGVSSQSMLDALQLLALAGAASAGVVLEADDVVAGLAERVAASARERLGLVASADEHETKRKRKRSSES